MKTNLKIHLEIDRDLLAPCNRVAGILAILPSHHLEKYLATLLSDLAGDNVLHVASDLPYESYTSRQLAETAAEKLEADAISEKLNGNPNANTVTTEVVEYRRGFWRVKVHIPTRTGWKLIAWDLWDEDEPADTWKKEGSK